MSNENKGSTRNKKNNLKRRKKEKANITRKVTDADIKRLKEHFDKKYGRS